MFDLWDKVDGEGDMPLKLYQSLGYFGPVENLKVPSDDGSPARSSGEFTGASAPFMSALPACTFFCLSSIAINFFLSEAASSSAFLLASMASLKDAFKPGFLRRLVGRDSSPKSLPDPSVCFWHC